MDLFHRILAWFLSVAAAIAGVTSFQPLPAQKRRNKTETEEK